jgi:hypothetical protein
VRFAGMRRREEMVQKTPIRACGSADCHWGVSNR